MRRRWLAGLVWLSCSWVPRGRPRPHNWGQLAQIILWLQQIDQTLRDLNVVVDDIRGNLAQVYPSRAASDRNALRARGLDQGGGRKAGLHWRFTPRVEKLRLALFGGGHSARSDWNLVFGPLRRPSTGISRATDDGLPSGG